MGNNFFHNNQKENIYERRFVSNAGNKDKQAPNTLEKDNKPESGVKENLMNKSENKRKKSIPKNICIITNDENKSKEVIAKAMAEMYKRMFNAL